MSFTKLTYKPQEESIDLTHIVNSFHNDWLSGSIMIEMEYLHMFSGHQQVWTQDDTNIQSQLYDLCKLVDNGHCNTCIH